MLVLTNPPPISSDLCGLRRVNLPSKHRAVENGQARHSSEGASSDWARLVSSTIVPYKKTPQSTFRFCLELFLPPEPSIINLFSSDHRRSWCLIRLESASASVFLCLFVCLLSVFLRCCCWLTRCECARSKLAKAL